MAIAAIDKNRTLKRSGLIIGVLAVLLAALLTVTGCGSSGSSSDSSSSSESSVGVKNDDGTVTLRAMADVTPHKEILDYANKELKKDGIQVDVVSTDTQSANEKVESGEIDFNYDQHLPYLKSWNEQNGTDLVSAGGIHLEPITAYSEKYKSTKDVPENAVIAIPNDPTNEYRALAILQKAGFITLDDSAKNNLQASTKDITKYDKKIKIVEIDSKNIISSKDDYDVFITNTNKFLESGVKAHELFKEDSDSPYANIICVKKENQNNEYIKKLVEVLQSKKVQNWINKKYKGAVIGDVVESQDA